MRRGEGGLGPAGTAVAAAVAVAVVGLVASLVLPAYFVFLGISAIVATISLLGLGVVTGSAGMISLCQLSFAAIGAWIVSWLNLRESPGGPLVWLLAAGVGAGLVGVAVGLPALRLRGVNLAVVTLGFAAAVDQTFVRTQFPGSRTFVPVIPPSFVTGDRSFFVFAVAVLAMCVFVVQLLRGTRTGSGWSFLSFSERGLASAGGSVPVTKLSAFAVSATLGGLGGGLVTMQVGIASAETFAPLQSLALYVLSIVVGSFLVDMAVFGGILFVGIPEVLKRFGVPQDWGLVAFGVLGIQALCSKSSLGVDIRRLLARRRTRRAPGATAGTAPVPSAGATAARAVAETDVRDGDGALLEVRGLTVTFGTVDALADVDLDLGAGRIMGLIGPNGAGKSTFIDALSGFLPEHRGRVRLAGTAVGRASPTRLARRGLRRTFQQDRVPTSLSVAAYVRYVARRRIGAVEMAAVLDFLDCPAPGTALATVDAGTRRLVEVAAQLAARPRLLLLDEPAAGLSHDGHLALGERLTQIPGRFGTSVILVEHDLDLVRRVCPTITVLDFGRVLAVGDRDSTLGSPEVARAYMGETVMT